MRHLLETKKKKKKFVQPTSWAFLAMDKNAFSSAPALGHRDAMVSDSNVGYISGMQWVPQWQQKSPERKVNSEGGEVVHLWQKKIKTPSSYSGSPTDKSSFPPAPVLGRGNTGVPDSNAGSLSDLLMVPESGKKAPEGKVSFEGGEVGFLWNKKK